MRTAEAGRESFWRPLLVALALPGLLLLVVSLAVLAPAHGKRIWGDPWWDIGYQGPGLQSPAEVPDSLGSLGFIGVGVTYLGSYMHTMFAECAAESTLFKEAMYSAPLPRPPDAKPRQPLALVVSGGGFRTMTAGIAYARSLSFAFEALGGQLGWDDITHLAGNSGGQWFATQLAFSRQFFLELTRRDANGRYVSLGHFFDLWGLNYAKGMYTGDTPSFDLYDRCAGSRVTSKVIGLVLGAIAWGLELAHFPAYNWQSYINHMLHCSIPDYESLTFDDLRPGLPEAALVEQLALPPDTWVGKDADVERVDVELPQGVPADATLPLAHIAKARSSQGGYDGFFAPALGAGPTLQKQPYTCDCGWTWWTNCPTERSMLWHARDDGSPCYSHCCNPTPNRPRPLSLRTRFSNSSTTSLSEVAAMSSAAAGLTSSPTIAKNALHTVLGAMGPKTRDALVTAMADEADSLASPADVAEAITKISKAEVRGFDWTLDKMDEFIDTCTPFGLQTLGVGLDLEWDNQPPLPEEDKRAWSPPYRGIDGVYVDNTAMIMTLANMIYDCEHDVTVDCRDRKLDLVLINDDDSSQPSTNAIGPMFRDYGVPVGSFEPSGMFTSVPSRRIFAEDYPSPERWTRYFTPGADTHPFKDFQPSRLPAEIISGLANGRLAESFGVFAESTLAAAMAKTGAKANDVYNSAANVINLLAKVNRSNEGGEAAAAEVVSRYPGSNFTQGEFTTIDNPRWGVKAGYTVNLLIFCISYPSDPLLRGGMGTDNDPLILGPLTAAAFFRTLYEPIARDEIEHATPHLTAWLRKRAKERNLKASKGWA